MHLASGLRPPKAEARGSNPLGSAIKSSHLVDPTDLRFCYG